MSDVRALTIRQPWASLVAVGAKTIETRSRPTSYRGPLLIHAGKATPDPVRPSDPALGPYSVGLAHDPGGGTWWAMERNECEDRWRLPLGAVVASAMLIDCVPIVESPCGTNTRRPDHVCTSGEDALLHRPEFDGVRGAATETVFVGERPFGDFTPGRFAWFLGDVKLTTERCPRCWGGEIRCTGFHGTVDEPAPCWGRIECGTCGDTFTVAPVPMRGRQGLFTPEWSS